MEQTIYQTFEPTNELLAFVKCYWMLESPKEENAQRQTIVPDGCMEMIFHYGDLYRQYTTNENSIIQPRCFVIGQLTRPLEIEATGSTGIFSVRFHPEGFMPLTTMPAKEMDNTATALQKIFDEEGVQIEEKILNSTTTAERIKFIEAFLMQKLSSKTTIDHVIRTTVEMILTANGQLSIDELSMQTNINRRQLERKFSSAIGLSPKQLSKTIRLQATLRLLLSKQFTSLTELAYEGEYYDQAHFIKDFKEFTGSTPARFYGENLKMSSLFYGTE